MKIGSKSHQLMVGAILMLPWVIIVFVQAVQEEGLLAPVILRPLFGFAGFFMWLFFDFLNERLWAFLPDSLSDPFEWGLVIVSMASWLVVFFLPLFGNWVNRRFLLHAIQFLYAVTQAGFGWWLIHS